MNNLWNIVWKPFSSSSSDKSAVASVIDSSKLPPRTPSLVSPRNSCSTPSSGVAAGKSKARRCGITGDENSRNKRIKQESSQNTSRSSSSSSSTRNIASSSTSTSAAQDRLSFFNHGTGTRNIASISTSTSAARGSGYNTPLQSNTSHVPMLGTWTIDKTYITSSADGNAKKNLLNSIFRHRASTLVAKKPDYQLSSKNPKKADHELVDDNGLHRTLVSFKSHDQAGGVGLFVRKVEFEWVFITVQGGGLPRINVQDELEKIADFRSLDTRKAVVRLGHLQSPASQVWNGLDCSQFEMIEEQGHVGCGYIPEDMLQDLFLECKYSKNKALNSLGIQVRIVGPKLGILKGMLFRKKNITKIQLPSSMLKVSPSTSKENVTGFDNQNWVYMLATQQGIFPSESNRILGQKLVLTYTGEEVPSANKKNNFRPKKPLTDMITRLWKGLGVSANLVDDYAEEIRRSEFCRHAWPVGVADPTGFIPKGHIYVTGLKLNKTQSVTSLFITRSPCVNPDDVKMLPLLTKRPPEMPISTWRWLDKLPFGSVIFPLCKSAGEKSLPETIAAGDLDGDLYFVCWDRLILSSFLKANEKHRWGDIELFDVVKGETNAVIWKETKGVCEIISDDEDDQDIVKSRSIAVKGGRNIEEKIKGSKASHSNDFDAVIEILSDDDDDEENEQYTFKEVVAHRKSRGEYELKVLWGDGTKTWEPLTAMIEDCRHYVREYSKKKGLMHLVEFQVADSEDDDDSCVSEDSDVDCEIPGSDWFLKAQTLMLDLPQMHDIKRLVGCLFKLNKLTAENSPEGIHDKDAIAFGAAYKKSLELDKHFEKHGGLVILPKHLHELVKPKQLQKFLG